MGRKSKKKGPPVTNESQAKETAKPTPKGRNASSAADSVSNTKSSATSRDGSSFQDPFSRADSSTTPSGNRTATFSDLGSLLDPKTSTSGDTASEADMKPVVSGLRSKEDDTATLGDIGSLLPPKSTTSGDTASKADMEDALANMSGDGQAPPELDLVGDLLPVGKPSRDSIGDETISTLGMHSATSLFIAAQVKKEVEKEVAALLGKTASADTKSHGTFEEHGGGKEEQKEEPDNYANNPDYDDDEYGGGGGNYEAEELSTAREDDEDDSGEDNDDHSFTNSYEDDDNSVGYMDPELAQLIDNPTTNEWQNQESVVDNTNALVPYGYGMEYQDQNLCYLNSLMQILYNVHIRTTMGDSITLSRKRQQREGETPESYEHYERCYDLVAALNDVLGHMVTNRIVQKDKKDKEIVVGKTKELVMKLRAALFRHKTFAPLLQNGFIEAQQDITEALGAILDALEETGSGGKFGLKGFVTGVTTACTLPACGKENKDTNLETVFKVPINHKGEDWKLLQTVISESLSYEGDDNFKCGHCLQKVNPRHNVRLGELPKNLLVQLGRYNNQKEKCDGIVSFGRYLQFEMWDENAETSAYGVYRVESVACHSGGQLNSGHYTVLKSDPQPLLGVADDKLPEYNWSFYDDGDPKALGSSLWSDESSEKLLMAQREAVLICCVKVTNEKERDAALKVIASSLGNIDNKRQQQQEIRPTSKGSQTATKGSSGDKVQQEGDSPSAATTNGNELNPSESATSCTEMWPKILGYEEQDLRTTHSRFAVHVQMNDGESPIWMPVHEFTDNNNNNTNVKAIVEYATNLEVPKVDKNGNPVHKNGKAVMEKLITTDGWRYFAIHDPNHDPAANTNGSPQKKTDQGKQRNAGFMFQSRKDYRNDGDRLICSDSEGKFCVQDAVSCAIHSILRHMKGKKLNERVRRELKKSSNFAMQNYIETFKEHEDDKDCPLTVRMVGSRKVYNNKLEILKLPEGSYILWLKYWIDGQDTSKDPPTDQWHAMNWFAERKVDSLGTLHDNTPGAQVQKIEPSDIESKEAAETAFMKYYTMASKIEITNTYWVARRGSSIPAILKEIFARNEEEAKEAKKRANKAQKDKRKEKGKLKRGPKKKNKNKNKSGKNEPKPESTSSPAAAVKEGGATEVSKEQDWVKVTPKKSKKRSKSALSPSPTKDGTPTGRSPPQKASKATHQSQLPHQARKTLRVAKLATKGKKAGSKVASSGDGAENRHPNDSPIHQASVMRCKSPHGAQQSWSYNGNHNGKSRGYAMQQGFNQGGGGGYQRGFNQSGSGSQGGFRRSEGRNHQNQSRGGYQRRDGNSRGRHFSDYHPPQDGSPAPFEPTQKRESTKHGGWVEHNRQY